MRLAIGADDSGRSAYEAVYPLPAVGRRDQGVPRHAWIARIDAAVLGAGMPLIDGGVVLHPRVGAGPGGVGDLVPDLSGGNARGDLAVGAALELPVSVLVEYLEEAAGHADRVVRVLPGDGEVGLAVPIGVVLREDDLGHARGRQMQGLLEYPSGTKAARASRMAAR